MTLYELLFREWKDIQLLNDIVEKVFQSRFLSTI